MRSPAQQQRHGRSPSELDLHHVQIAPAMGISQLDQFASAHGAALLATRDILSTLADPTTGLRPFTCEAYTASVAS